MNKKAQELNLKHTHFITPHGLDEEGHYTTGYELALIADYALNIEKIAKVVSTKVHNVNINGNIKTITNTNELLGYLDGVNGIKTGFTNGAVITWAGYLLYVHLRLFRKTGRKTLYVLLIMSFLALQMCWYGVNYLPAAQQSVHLYNRNN